MTEQSEMQVFSTARENHVSVHVDFVSKRTRILNDAVSRRDLAEAVRRQRQSAGIRILPSASR